MANRLADRVAIVTGSNSGIGRAVAIAYAREGAIVICANRNPVSKDPEEADVTTHDLIVKQGGRAEFIKVTITDQASVQALVDAIVAKHGRIDILVNNVGAGSWAGAMFWDCTDKEGEEIFGVNVHGTLKMMRAVSKVMMAQEPLKNARADRGFIINTGSVFGPRASPQHLLYNASKAALIALTKTAAVELAPHRIHVHVVNPGTVVTALTKGGGFLEGPGGDYLQSRALLGFGKPEDVAGTYVFLASDEASWMTGTEIFVDSGYVLP